MIEIHSSGRGKNDLKDDDLVCHCFHYTKGVIRSDYAAHGRSTILERITREKKAGGCDCARKNPKKR